MRILRISLPLVLAAAAWAQYPGLTLPPSGNNQKAAVTQYIGPVKVSIEYSSPAVHGPDGKDRRGQIWGKLVPYGMNATPFGNGKPGPWRAGANENTVFEVSHAVLVGGKPLPAGRYGLHMMVGPEEWTLILSKNADAWGSFFYEESQDALRVAIQPHKHEYREYLTYEFTNRKPSEATAELQWEDLTAPFTVQVENVNDLYISRMEKELTTVPGFSSEGFLAAAQFCLTENTHLEQGLAWADDAIGRRFIGQANFQTLSTKAQILSKLHRDSEAKQVMVQALNHPTATALMIHQYGRQLLAEKKNQEALEVFQLNAKRNGDAWPVHVGLARAYAALGDKPQALEHARKALAQAPDELNRKSLEGMVESLSR